MIYLNILFVWGILFMIFQTANLAKLNVPRVLLPVFNNVLINYTLEVTEGGCYRWTVSRLDLVMLQTENVDRKLGCSTKAIITAISREKSRNTAIVLAEDVITKNVLRCDVILDVIHSLGIVTTTRELFVEEAPEAFEVEAYDAQGNQFTTLEGVEFSWSVSPNVASRMPYETDGDNNLSVGSVQITSFMNSPYETPSSVLCFDGQGKFGHIALLEGLNTGSVKVNVKLSQSEYNHVKTLEVPLLVVANLLLQPAEVYLLQGDTIFLQVLQVRKGRVHKVDLRHGQYYLEAEDHEIIKLDGALVAGIKFGTSRVFVKDHNSRTINPAVGLDIPKLPEGKVIVTFPDKLRITLQPYDNWITIIGKKYTITAELYTSEDQKMHIGENVRIKISVDEKLFNVIDRSINGSIIEGIPIKAGVSKVYAELLQIEGSDGKIYRPARLTATAEMLIFDQINLTPSEVILPWDPVTRSRFEVQLYATGGDGDFIWSSEDPSVVAVSQHGLITTLSLGFSKIKAAMSRNSQNYETADIYVIAPMDLQIVDYILEVPVGSELSLHVALFGIKITNELGDTSFEDKLPFSDCYTLPLHMEFDEDNFVIGGSGKPEPSTIGISCASLTIKAMSPGVCRVTVHYDLANGHSLKDSIIVSAFKPLEVVEPISASTVLAIGSSRNIIFSGGPRPWLGKPTEHIYSIHTDNPEKLQVIENNEHTSAGRSGIYVYNVLCRSVGARILTFSVGNKPTLPNCHHKFSEIAVSVLCAYPRSIHLVPVLSSPDPASCPLDINSEPAIQHNYRDIKIEIEVRDNLGRKFDNITSLKVDWNIDPCQLSLCNDISDFQSLVKYVYDVEVPDKFLQVLPTRGKSGTLKIHSNIKTYKTSILKNLQITSEWPEFGIENNKGVLETPLIHDSITLYLSRDTEIIPNNITLFNHPDNKGRVSVSQGSGYYELQLTNDNIAKVSFDNRKHELVIQPLNKGRLRVDLIDLCLSSQTPSLYINIVSIQTILVDMPNRVEKGQCIKAIVKLLDEFDQLMPLPEEYLLNLRSDVESDIVNVKMAPQDPLEPWGTGEIHFIVTGLEIGETKILFKSGYDRREVESDLLKVQVFAPLKLSPRNMTLIVGSSMQIFLKGGPSVDMSVEFITDKDKIAEVRSGVVTGLAIGHTRITGRAIGFNPTMGAMVTYSQDTIDVYVIPLSGIKIHTPLVQAEVGAIIPFWISGSPDSINPMILGSRKPPLKVSWEASGPDTGVVSIRNVFHHTGIDLTDSDQISVRVVGVRPGRVQIKAKLNVPVSVGIWRTDNVLTYSIDLEIITPLKLISPSLISNHILIAPDTKLNLQTNKQTRNRVSYSVQSWESHSSNNSSPSELTVSKTGVLEVKSGSGIGLLIISTKDDSGIQQLLAVAVECKPIHYIVTDIMSPLKLSQKSKQLPRGLSVTMALSHYDNLGRKMFASSPDLGIEMNRMDLASVAARRDNASFQVDLLLTGETMLMISKSGDGKTLTDYIKLTVNDTESSIANYSSFTIGDVICFSSQMNVDGGYWYSSDPSIINIDSKTGIARMLKETTTSVTVMFNINDITIYKVDLTILPIQKLTVLPVETIYFTGEKMHIDFILNAEGKDVSSNLICSRDVVQKLQPQIGPSTDLFSCHLTADDTKTTGFLEKVYAIPSFNFTSGLYSCSLASNYPVTNIYAESSILLTIRSGAITSTFRNIKLLPPVHVTPRELFIQETGSTFLTITGHDIALDKISIKVNDPKTISVDKYSASLGQIRYRVHIKNYEYAKIVVPFVFVSVPITNQYFKIPVNLRDVPDFCYFGTGSPLLALLYYYRYPLMFLATILALILGSVYFHANKVQKRTCSGHPGVTCDPNCPAHFDKTNPGLFNKSSARCYPDGSPAGKSPTQEINLGSQSPMGGSRFNSSLIGSDTSPVYGDATYYPSPEARRNRRFI